MLAELAAANAAFGIIKSAISNGKELVDVGKQIGQFVGAEEDLKAKAEAKKKSPFNKFMGKDTNDFEEFLALDKIEQQKAQLMSHMRLYGRPGLYDSWVEYQGKARAARKAALRQRQKEAEEMQEIIFWVAFVAIAWGGIGYGIYWWYFQ